MSQPLSDNLFFIDSIRDFRLNVYPNHILHLLCIKGSMSFIFRNIQYNITVGDYVIFVSISLVTDFSVSDDFEAQIMALSEAFTTSIAIRSNYGIVGHLSLLLNPVMRLSDSDFSHCLSDLQNLYHRLNQTRHQFHREMVEHLLVAHILDLYDIHARNQSLPQVSEHTCVLLGRFINILSEGSYISHRNLGYYASLLCITPHYLTEICRKASGRPATYWIEYFTLQAITRMLQQKELSLSDVAVHFHFSSLSYFSRYVEQRMGIPPSRLRKS